MGNLQMIGSDFYHLAAKTQGGAPLEMKDFEGKAVLIINNATKC